MKGGVFVSHRDSFCHDYGTDETVATAKLSIFRCATEWKADDV